MLGRTVKMAFWVIYDHLGKLIVANLAWFVLAVAPLLAGLGVMASPSFAVQVYIGLPLAAFAAGVCMPVVMAGQVYMAKELVDTRDGSVQTLFAGMRRFWRQAVGLSACYVFAGACLASSAWFYGVKLRGVMGWAGLGLSALALWGLLFAGLTALLALPTLAHKQGGVFETLKVAALLVLDNPLFALGLAAQFGALAACSVFVPLVLLMTGSTAAVLMACAYEQLARKYALIALRESGADVPESGAPLEGFSGGVRVVARGGRLVIDEEQDDYLNRGFRDFLFPWKG